MADQMLVTLTVDTAKLRHQIESFPELRELLDLPDSLQDRVLTYLCEKCLDVVPGDFLPTGSANEIAQSVLRIGLGDGFKDVMAAVRAGDFSFLEHGDGTQV